MSSSSDSGTRLPALNSSRGGPSSSSNSSSSSSSSSSSGGGGGGNTSRNKTQSRREQLTTEHSDDSTSSTSSTSTAAIENKLKDLAAAEEKRLNAVVQFDNLEPDYGLRLIDGNSGVKIVDVIKGGPADLAGIRQGDILLSISSRPILKKVDFDKYILGQNSSIRVGDKANFKVTRGGATGPTSIIVVEVGAVGKSQDEMRKIRKAAETATKGGMLASKRSSGVFIAPTSPRNGSNNNNNNNSNASMASAIEKEKEAEIIRQRERDREDQQSQSQSHSQSQSNASSDDKALSPRPPAKKKRQSTLPTTTSSASASTSTSTSAAAAAANNDVVVGNVD